MRICRVHTASDRQLLQILDQLNAPDVKKEPSSAPSRDSKAKSRKQTKEIEEETDRPRLTIPSPFQSIQPKAPSPLASEPKEEEELRFPEREQAMIEEKETSPLDIFEASEDEDSLAASIRDAAKKTRESLVDVLSRIRERRLEVDKERIRELGPWGLVVGLVFLTLRLVFRWIFRRLFPSRNDATSIHSIPLLTP